MPPAHARSVSTPESRQVQRYARYMLCAAARQVDGRVVCCRMSNHRSVYDIDRLRA